MRNFSDRSRPARNALRASSDEVVIAILPLALAAGALLAVEVLLGSTWHPASASKIRIGLSVFRRSIAGSLNGSVAVWITGRSLVSSYGAENRTRVRMSQDFLRELVQLYRSVDLIHYYGAFKMKPRRRMFFTHAVSRPLLVPVSTNRVCKLSTQSRPSSPPKPCAPCGITTCKLFGSVR